MTDLSRRTMLAGAAALAPAAALAQTPLRYSQPSVISNPPRQWGPGFRLGGRQGSH